ncbi:MAG TPA: efflux RND transporter periplasmic adaptor subunit [Isosphaeraceae bacterium]|jgi:Cu(I)/Ag(I) efflux system membrane fusion protein|nr:efflux RND transporter periplasmic adaptor subunit [Isosphaeraceae bacterium]
MSHQPQEQTGPGPEAPPLSGWKKFRLVVKVVELRLRFVLLMAITGLTFAYWDTIWNYYDKWTRPPAEKVAAAAGVEYYCPMHPSVVRDEPGTCPVCGMNLTKRKKGEKEALPEGTLARVKLAPFRVRQAGVATADVAYAPLAETLTTVGFVEYDERLIRQIASKVRGLARIERLFVNFTGVDVKAGEPLAEVYGPELYQAVRELLLAQQVARGATAPRSATARAMMGDPGQMLALARDKLGLMGVTPAQIDDILKHNRADFKLPILSPISGHVSRLDVREGQYVEEGRMMFEVVDLRRVWIKARVFEDQVGLIRVGQGVEAKIEGLPGTFAGAVEFVQPHLDPATRTLEVRYGLDNPDHVLRPGMYATVTLKTPVAETPLFRTKLAARRTAPKTTDGVRRVSLTVEEQEVCPVTGAKLGSMGAPVPVEVQGSRLWTCCKACPPKVQAEPARYIAKVSMPTPEEQQICPVTGLKLGSMGDPIRVEVQGRSVWVCCPACPAKLKAEPSKYLPRLDPAPKDEVLSVPESAVVDTGALTMVYVETKPGVFDGRKVVLGPRIGDRFPVLEGLAPGEKVVAAGAFLVDAESRLDPSTRPAAADAPAPMPMPAGHHHGG